MNDQNDNRSELPSGSSESGNPDDVSQPNGAAQSPPEPQSPETPTPAEPLNSEQAQMEPQLESQQESQEKYQQETQLDIGRSSGVVGQGPTKLPESAAPLVSAAMDLDDPALRKEIEATLARHGYGSSHSSDQPSSLDRSVSRRQARHAAPKSPLPRELVLAWCLWLLGGLMVTWAMKMPAAEMIRWMVMGSLIGMMLLWPTFRLSQSSGGFEILPDKSDITNQPNLISPMVILRDWFFLILVFQAVIWPLRLTARWTIPQTVWLDAAVSAWTLLTAALIAWGCRSNRGRDRTLAMILCLGLLFGEPIVMWLVNLGASPPGAPQYTWSMRITPFETIWTLTHLRAVNVSRPSEIGWLLWPLSLSVLVVAAAAIVAWAIVGLTSLMSGRVQAESKLSSTDI